MSPKLFSFSDVSPHSNSGDCWIIVHGKVYDVSKFLNDHPGGDDVILSATGKDATDDFEDVGHSKSAKDMLKDFYIGDIDASTIPNSTKYVPPKQPAYNHDKSLQFYIKIVQFVAPIAILGLAVAVHYYSKTTA